MSIFDYVQYDYKAQELQNAAKEAVQKVHTLVEALPPGRYRSLAITSLEEAYCWIGKAIRDNQIQRNGSAPLQEARNDG